jgi:leader peptidase (prepilin peptidase)/N-methyltransferase
MNHDILIVAAALILGYPAAWLVNQTCLRLAAGPSPLNFRVMSPVFSALLAWGGLAGPGGGLLAATAILAWALAALALVDALTLRLPNLLTYPLTVAGLLVSLFLPQPDLPGHVIGALAGFGALAGVASLYRRLRGRDGLGLGDAKLMAAAGAWLGWQSLPTVLLAACACAFLWLLFQAVRQRSVSPGQPMAFGPPLCAGIWLAWLYGPLGILVS